MLLKQSFVHFFFSFSNKNRYQYRRKKRNKCNVKIWHRISKVFWGCGKNWGEKLLLLLSLWFFSFANQNIFCLPFPFFIRIFYSLSNSSNQVEKESERKIDSWLFDEFWMNTFFESYIICFKMKTKSLI